MAGFNNYLLYSYHRPRPGDKIWISYKNLSDDDDQCGGGDNKLFKLGHGWRPPRGGERAQRDTAPKLIVIHFAKIQNWGGCCDDLW